MSSSPNGPPSGSDREIHRLFDGDLAPEEVAALIEAEKKRDPRGSSGTRVKLEALGDLRALIRAATSDESDPIDADAAWAQIAARIEGATSAEIEQRAAAPKAVGRPNLRVIEGGLSDKTPGDRARESSTAGEPRVSEGRPVDRAPERAESAPPGLLQRIDRATADRDEETKRRERQVRQRRKIIMIVSGLAAAAAAAIAFLGPGEEPTPDPVVAIEDGAGNAEAPIFDPVADELLRHTEVISVDFGPNAGTVFSVEGTEGSRYAVVWLTDEAEKAADPTATNGDDDDSPAPSPDDTANL